MAKAKTLKHWTKADANSANLVIAMEHKIGKAKVYSVPVVIKMVNMKQSERNYVAKLIEKYGRARRGVS